MNLVIASNRKTDINFTASTKDPMITMTHSKPFLSIFVTSLNPL
jgi:hypothetical protein